MQFTVSLSDSTMAGGEEKDVRSSRPSVKALSSFNNYPKWKDKLRENCFRRVRDDRTRLLWKLRSPEPNKSSDHQEFIKVTLQDIVSDELKKIKEASPNGSPAPLLEPGTNDMIWEFDGLHTAYQGDCQEILLEMQRIFYEDLRTENSITGTENSVKTWEDEEDEYLSHLVYDHMLLSNDQASEEVWCPICKQIKLQDNEHHIYCSRCKLKLKKGHEVNLNILRLRLGEAHTEHLDRGCRLSPDFCVETNFGLTALYIKCQGCDTFEIVL